MTQAATLAQLASSGALTADTSGNVGVGGTNTGAYGKLGVLGTGYQAVSVQSTDASGVVAILAANSSAETRVGSISNHPLYFMVNADAKARIDTSGNFLVGTADAGLTSGVGLKLNGSSTTIPTFGLVLNYNIGTSSHLHLYNTNATNNGYRFYVVSNGGIYNFSGNNSNLSDERKKTNIELSGNYLSKICNIPVKLFNYKDEPEDEQKTLGVIAQDVEKVAPELVNNVGFGDTVEGEEPFKSIYTTDMMFALMKSIQELKAELDVCKAEIAALKGV